MTTKDETISCLSRELEAAKKDIEHRDCLVSAYESYVSQLPSFSDDDERYVDKDREVNLLRQIRKRSETLQLDLSTQVPCVIAWPHRMGPTIIIT